MGLAYYLSRQSQHAQAKGRFESIAERALVIASLRMEEKKYSANALAHMASSVGPTPDFWPNLAIPNYERIAGSLRNVTQGEEMILCPLIHAARPLEQASFEEFVHHYVHGNSGTISHVQENHDHNGTLLPGESSFGFGIFSLGNDSAPDNRYHDTTGNTTWGSPFPILVPAFQFDQGFHHPHLLMNLHQGQITGQTIDGIIRCSLQRTELDDFSRECGALTDFIWQEVGNHDEAHSKMPDVDHSSREDHRHRARRSLGTDEYMDQDVHGHEEEHEDNFFSGNHGEETEYGLQILPTNSREMNLASFTPRPSLHLARMVPCWKVFLSAFTINV